MAQGKRHANSSIVWQQYRWLNLDQLRCDHPIYQRSVRSNGSRKRGKKEKEKLERPKVVLNRNRETAFGHFLLFHALPLGATIVLIVINVKTQFYGNDGKWISALQFAAKAHELL